MLEKCLNYGMRLVWILLAFHHQGGKRALFRFQGISLFLWILLISKYSIQLSHCFPPRARLHNIKLVFSLLCVVVQIVVVQKYKLPFFPIINHKFTSHGLTIRMSWFDNRLLSCWRVDILFTLWSIPVIIFVIRQVLYRNGRMHRSDPEWGEFLFMFQ